METLVKLASETKSGESLIKEAFGMPGVGLAIKGYQRVSASKAMKAIARAMGKAKATATGGYGKGMGYAKMYPKTTAGVAGGAAAAGAGAYAYRRKKKASDEVSTICKEAMQSANEAAQIL